MCKICQNKSKVLEINDTLYEYCDSCEFLNKAPGFIVSEEKEKERYDLHDNDFSNDYYNYQRKFFLDIKKYLGALTLDFGTGLSHMLPNVLEDHSYRVNYYDKYYYPDKKALNFSYDSIILEEVLEHLRDPLGELKNLVNILNVGGYLIIRTRFYKDLNKLATWWYLRDITHISFFTLKTFSKLSELLNLKIVFTNKVDLIVLQK